MELRVLGPLEVVDDGRKVSLRRRERDLLAVLLVFSPALCNREMLAQALWQDDQPADPAAALRTCISRARRALGPAIRLKTSHGAIRAEPAPGTVLDLGLFQQLRDEAEEDIELGKLRPASVKLDQALACWRGMPLADLPDIPEIAAEQTRLQEQQRLTRLTLTDILLDLGDHERILPDLHAQVIADPGCERSWAQLVLALHQGGRRAQALAYWAKARAEYVQHLGAEPGAELQDLLCLVQTGTPAASRYRRPRVAGRRAPEPAPALT